MPPRKKAAAKKKTPPPSAEEEEEEKEDDSKMMDDENAIDDAIANDADQPPRQTQLELWEKENEQNLLHLSSMICVT